MPSVFTRNISTFAGTVVLLLVTLFVGFLIYHEYKKVVEVTLDARETRFVELEKLNKD